MFAPCPPFDETRRQMALDELEVLDTPADPHLDTLVRLARECFGVGAVLISLIDHDRQWFKARTGLALSETSRQVSFCSHAIVQDDMLVVEDALEDPCFRDNPIVTGPPYLRFYAGQQLRDENDVPLGTFCLIDFKPRTLSAAERDRLRDFAYLAMGYLQLNAMSRQAAELREALTRAQRKAMLDPLTQVWNRAGLEHLLPRERLAVKARNLQLGLLLCDLDHFKVVNDTHGHACGDQALWETARRLGACLRPSDLVARIGGEEFVILTRVKNSTEMARIAERVRRHMAATPVRTEPAELQPTLSIGCTLLRDDEDPAEAMERADRALYQAKEQGRNRVVTG